MSLSKMVKISTFTLSTLLVSTASAAQLARRVPQALQARDANAGGGWGLSTTVCPSGTTACGSSWCCPNSLTCNRIGSANIANLCCPAATTCLSPLQQTPFCADKSWSLWQSTDNPYPFGWLCCLPGQVGIQKGDCVASETVVQETMKAKLISAASATTTGSTAQASSTSGSASGTSGRSSTGTGTTSGSQSTGSSGSSSNSNSNSSSDSSTSKSGLSIGAIVGIVVGVIVLALIVLGIICCLCIKNRRMKKKLAHQPYNDKRVFPATAAPGTPGLQSPDGQAHTVQALPQKHPEAAFSPHPTPSPVPTPITHNQTPIAQLPAHSNQVTAHQLPAEQMPAQLEANSQPRFGDSRMPAQLE